LNVFLMHGMITVVVDSIGRKIYGEGEWEIRVFKRRFWNKLHSECDPNGLNPLLHFARY